jgi:trehalose 6-phosphate phosphatase
MTLCTPEWIEERLDHAPRLGLFLDYDGTLADFAPTPEHVDPDPHLIALLARLARSPRIRVAVISGRRLSHVEKLVPVADVLLAGTYGVELRTPDGEHIDRVSYSAVRPPLEELKPRWARLIAERDGFFLEDKDWALAIHARFADPAQAEAILAQARRLAMNTARAGPFRILGGDRFLEVGPHLANKGTTVAYLLQQDPWADALPLYLGDDDKDEEAFGVIQAHGGIAILVCPEPRQTEADCRLESPQAARRWLDGVADRWQA